MLPTIDFDDQVLFPADKVDDVAADCFLPNKLEATQSPITKGKPQLSLRISLRTAKLALDLNFLCIRTAHLPLTRLAPSVLATLSPQ